MFGFLRQRFYCQLFIALALGVVVGRRYPMPADLLLGDAPLLLAIALLLVLLWLRWRDRAPWLAYLPGYTLLFLGGIISTSLALSLALTAPLRALAGGGPQVLTGRVVSIPKYQNGHLRFMLAVDGPGREQPAAAGGLCMVYLRSAEIPELYCADRIQLTAHLGEVEPPLNRGQFDYRGYLLIQGTVLTAYAVDTSGLQRLNDRPAWVWRQVAQLRAYLTRNLLRGQPGDLGQLAVSVVYGDKITDLPDATSERFRRAGLTHILVASGTQISLLVFLLSLLLLRFADDFSWRGWLINFARFGSALALVLVYAAVTGFETSIVRALAMGVLLLTGRLLYREVDGLTSLAQAGLVLLLFNPLLLFSPGFQLSFGATFGLIYACGIGFPLAAHLRRAPRHAWQMLISTGGAQLTVLPLLAAAFYQLSLWGLVSNLLAIPLAFWLLLAGGLNSLGLGYVPGLGLLLQLIVLGLSWLLDGVARLFAALPLSSIAVPPPPAWWILAYFGLYFTVGELIKLRRRLTPVARHLLAAGATVSLLVVAGGLLAWWLIPRPELSALALPFGEGYLWRSWSGRSVLLLRGTGLERSHNADTVVSALACRGINHLHGLVWLDEPPAEPGPLPAVRPQSLGAAVPAEWDLTWLRDADLVWGAVCHWPSRQVWLVWDGFPPGHAARLAEAGGTPQALLINGKTWNSLGRERQAELSAICPRIALSDPRRRQDTPGVFRSAREIHARPQAVGVGLGEYSPRTP